jgi:peptide/nickel transport system permease protein
LSAALAPSAGRRAAELGRELLRHPGIVVGGAILLVVVFFAVFADVLWTIDPQRIQPRARLRPPSDAHWFGGDMVGRDVYSRTVYGARVSLIVGLAVAAIAVAGGLVIGLLAGFLRGFDAVAMRVMDGLMSIPAILLAVALIALTGASMGNVIAAIAISEIPRVARLTRSVVLSIKERPYIEAAIAVGTRFHHLLIRHVLPNAAAPLLVQGSYIFASAVLVEAALSFIGAGTPPSIPSWGNIIAEGRAVFQIAPHIVVFPGIALAATVLAVNLIGDGLRDAFDPRFVGRL